MPRLARLSEFIGVLDRLRFSLHTGHLLLGRYARSVLILVFPVDLTFVEWIGIYSGG